MTPELQAGLIAAIPPTVMSLSVIVIAVISRGRAQKSLDHITVLTNSSLSEAKEKIEHLEKTVTSLVEFKANRNKGNKGNKGNPL